MRISLPPRPGVAGVAKPVAAGAGGVPKNVPPTPGPAKGPVAPGKPAVVAGGKPAPVAGAGVRTVVDTDSAGTALAIAALLASLISFGVVLMSFLQK